MSNIKESIKNSLTNGMNRGIIDLHSDISYIKSMIRIVGFGFLGIQRLDVVAVLLTIAEIVGIIEEVVI